ncbi:efflux RND transporter permease subunit [Treponema endosymbiont of Eucomonympha sp.]|uniref:efflux RND transporter permease subunit n=1 Tax=Treponema endosymbiont of Eucomonympha sp. TaxID=1580831 RepID=UPI0007819A58|nr:efflux RND transporter permease subunit [Treponema endosymbiont of Eucomonympha sp.]
MQISELSVRKPVTVTMLYVLVCVVSLVFLPRLGIALYPNVTPPYINVMTTYTNAGPEEVDKAVTQVIVNRLERVADVKSITSRSSSGQSRIQLEFGYDKNLDEATNDVSDALSRVLNSLPDDCGAPSVFKFSMNARPIMRLAVTGGASLGELKTLAEDTVSPLLERVSGVASAEVNGGAVREVRVDVSNNRLEAYGLTLGTVTAALAARNVQLSSGTLTHGATDYEIVTDEYFRSLGDIRDTVVSGGGGAAAVRLSDVAEVYEGTERGRSLVYINGEPGLYISITNESGTNPSTISKDVHAALAGIRESLPKGVSVSVLSDDTSLIDSTLNEVYSSAVTGAALAMLLIFLFLRNFRSSLIIGLSIPISILITLTAMAALGLTINMMTMSGLILGMGMTVDSSIVIIENINKRRSWGEKSAIAAILGSRNMLLAIIASTATTVCVFVPVLIYRAELETFGMMFQELVVTVVVSLVASLIVSVTLVPALCGSILKIDTRTQKPLRHKIPRAVDRAVAGALEALENGYARALRFALRNRLLVMMLAVSMLIPAVQRFASGGMNLAPSSQADDQVNVTVTLPVGTTNTEVRKYLFAFQDIVTETLPKEAYKTVVLNTGNSNSGTIQLTLPKLKEQTLSARQVRDALEPHMSQWSGARVSFSSGRGFRSSGGGLDIKLVSDDAAAASAAAGDIAALLKAKLPQQLTDVENGLEDGSPRYEIHIDTDAAAAAGVSVGAVSALLKTAISGTAATIFHTGGDDANVVVRLAEESLLEPSALGAIGVQSANGIMPLDSFITYAKSVSPQQIQREEGVRVSHVTAALAPGAVMTDAQAAAERLIRESVVLPDTVKIEYGGDASDLSRLLGTFVFVILLAAFLVFAVMAAQFESLVDPFIIFASIPLLAIGVMLAHAFMKQPLSLYSFVGIVALVGIVVNNGIVLVDFTNQLVDRKTPVFEACIEAGRNRLQPILMTTLTTVLGMVPMAFFPGAGAEAMQPICLTIVGGLMSGAFMTLFVSPVLYSALNKRREKRFNDPESLLNQLAELDARPAATRIS